ncbi:MAG: PAC2 family protein [archaeon]
MSMEIELKERPQKPIVIQAFPGIAMVGTIAAEFLIDHLKARRIGRIYSEEVPPIIALHHGKVIEPFSIFYDKVHNIVIVSALETIPGKEWEMGNTVLKLCKTLKASELISIEGVESPNATEPRTFYCTNNKKREKKLKDLGLKELDEGVIMGVAAALLLKSPESTYIFSETHSEMPDSRAAAKIIESLDKYIGLKVDYAPLVDKADAFEKKLKELLCIASQQTKEKKETYLG